MKKLSVLQRAILQHMLTCESGQAETVTHIAKTLEIFEASISRSINSMIDNGYLVRGRKKERSLSTKSKIIVTLPVTLTVKGLVTSVAIGITLDKAIRYCANNPSLQQEIQVLFEIKKLFKEGDKQNFFIKSLAEAIVQNDLFDVNNVRQLSLAETNSVLTNVINKYLSKFGDDPKTLSEIVTRWGFDKEFLKQLAIKEQARIDSMQKALEDV